MVYFVNVVLFQLSGCGWLVGPSERSANAVIQGVRCIGVSVSDIEQMTAFYQKNVDFEHVLGSLLSLWSIVRV